MTKNVNDITLFLKTINEFRNTPGIEKNRLFFLIQEQNPLIQWDIELDQIYLLCITLNVLIEKDKRVQITEKGLDLLDLSDSGFDLNDSQLTYICENCFFNNNKFYELKDFLKLFYFEKKYNTFIFNTNNYPVPQKLPIELLSQLQIIEINGNLWKLNPNYIQFIEQEEINKNNLTPQQLEKILEEQKKVGLKAEQLTMEFEIQRLKKMNLKNESQRVKQISLIYVNRGYDIESFSKKSPSFKHDFFIEVKGRKHRLSSFIISSNELRVAKNLGRKYSIYFWNGLGSKNPPTSPSKIIIDPYNTLKIQECENCLHYLISLE